MSDNQTSKAVEDLLEDSSNYKAYGENLGDNGDEYIDNLIAIAVKYQRMEEALEPHEHHSRAEQLFNKCKMCEAMDFDPLKNPPTKEG